MDVATLTGACVVALGKTTSGLFGTPGRCHRGAAWAEDAKPYQPKGPTGVGVRTLAELALDVDAWGTQ